MPRTQAWRSYGKCKTGRRFIDVIFTAKGKSYIGHSLEKNALLAALVGMR
jgi:hypothetical protein